MRLVTLFFIGTIIIIVGLHGNLGSALAAIIDPTALTEAKS